MKTKIVSAMAACVLLTGCFTTQKQKQIESIGRDWSKVIRASQVIPVYPLTEDLLPGDVFLVQTPVDQQQKVWNKDGYLPLDNHLARIHPNGYGSFYEKGFFKGQTNVVLPKDWMFSSDTNQLPWQSAPRVAFPTYGFTVKMGAGASLAVPVQGVPVGLSLMGTDSANGTIAIRNALTLGIDTLSLYDQLKEWAKTEERTLQAYEAPAGEPPRNYLRAVTRVFATGQVEIGLADASARSGGLDVGVPKPVNLLYADLPTGVSNTATATLTNYSRNLGQVNSNLSVISEAAAAAGKVLPGGSLRVNAASSRYISMSETFPKPLVIGYLGFDCAILRGGIIGPPIATFATLEGRVSLTDAFGNEPMNRIYQDELVLNLYEQLQTADAAKVELDALDQFVPANWTYFQYDSAKKTLVETNPPTGSSGGYRQYRAYNGRRPSSQNAIAAALGEKTFTLVKGGRQSAITKDSPERKALAEIQSRLAPRPIERSAVSQAEDRLIRQFIQKLAY